VEEQGSLGYDSAPLPCPAEDPRLQRKEIAVARPTVDIGVSGPDVYDAILRLNMSGAEPQVPPSETFSEAAARATEWFQETYGLTVDGVIGPNTWALLDQLAADRLLPAADVPTMMAAIDDARTLRDAGDLAGAKSILTTWYEDDRLPPEVRYLVAAPLGRIEHLLGDTDHARNLYNEVLAMALLFGAQIVVRDTMHRLRELELGRPPGPVPSAVNDSNLPPPTP
jgi:hypothetical protein